MPPRTAEQALIGLYAAAARRLRVQIRRALANHAIGTAAYRTRQLEAIQLQLRALGQRTRRLAIDVAFDPYLRGATAVDVAGVLATRATVAFEFTGTHRRAANVIAQNLAARLGDATVTIGRRTEDAFRRVGLAEVGRGVVAGDTRRQTSAAITQRLIDEGVTDAVTGFVDRAGRRWQLDVYSETVARTTTREAMSAGTVARMRETNQQLITITHHAGACDICLPYEGRTFAIPGAIVAGYPTIDQLPPFHPRCRHVATPADANLDSFLAAIAGHG